MELLYHPLVQRDIREVLEWYATCSDIAGAEFFKDFEATVEAVRLGRRHGIRLDQHTHKVYLKRFPYSVTYELTDDMMYVFVVKHQKRRSSVGMRRSRPSSAG